MDGTAHRSERREVRMNPVALLSMLALLMVWIGIGVVVVAYGTPLGLACYILAAVATNPRVWRLR
jgi:hypothetical protein